jgi:hypothetical protein
MNQADGDKVRELLENLGFIVEVIDLEAERFIIRKGKE